MSWIREGKEGSKDKQEGYVQDKRRKGWMEG